MKYKAILFDMDGTLLPMDMEAFTKGYFKGLSAKLAKYGIEPEALVQAVWAGTKAMVKNDGTCSNETAFWRVFEQTTGLKMEQVNPDCIDFYGNEFEAAKAYTGENPLAVKAVRIAHEKADKVVLATNPIFPLVGQKTRMGWVGLCPEDFDLVTSYESDCYCKPNPSYFLSICERLNIKPQECLLIGNDEGEDMYAGTLAGLDCYLVTDCRIDHPEHPWNGKQGTFAEMVDMLAGL
ncbi:MAG: HAD family hydrolase [Agathobacter sp.]|nr:HAD family hydrolase [Agathobacter sp.]